MKKAKKKSKKQENSNIDRKLENTKTYLIILGVLYFGYILVTI